MCGGAVAINMEEAVGAAHASLGRVCPNDTLEMINVDASPCPISVYWRQHFASLTYCELRKYHLRDDRP